MSDGEQIKRPLDGSADPHMGRRREPRKPKNSETESPSTDGHLSDMTRERHSAIVVFSSDHEVLALASEAAAKNWEVLQGPDAGQAQELLSRLKVRLVVIDDQNVDPPMRGWLLEQVRKHAPSALVIYIAAEHDLDGERRARAHPVQFYTARPLDADRVRRVLESFVRAAR